MAKTHSREAGWLCFVAVFESSDSLWIDLSKAQQSHLNAVCLIKCYHIKTASFAATSLRICSFLI